MIYAVNTAPTAFPVDLQEAKRHLNIQHNNHNTYINQLIDTAIAYCEMVTWRKFMEQTIDYYLSAFPDEDYILLPFGELSSVTSIIYTESDDSSTVMSNTEYSVDTMGDKIMLDYGESWPSATLAELNPIKITYVCGWTNREDVPAPIKQAISLCVGHWYANREPMLIGVGVSATALPLAVDALLMPYRNWRML